jgi:hypothetical protein
MKKTIAYVLVVAAVLVGTPASALIDADSDKNQAAIDASAGTSTSRDLSSSNDTLATSTDPGSGSAEPMAPGGDHMVYNHYQAEFLQEVWTRGGGD